MPGSTLSLVIPVFNEEAVLPLLFPELDRVIAGLDLTVEVVFVNDGSRDRSLALLEEYARRSRRVSVIDFSRNWGHQAAISAGIERAKGDAIVVMDADLQDPPDLIRDMVTRWRAGKDVVTARRIRREGETAARSGASYIFYRLLRAVSGVDIPLDVGDFRLISRRVADEVKACPEHNRFVRGIVAWVGFDHDTVDFVRPARPAGDTHYPLRKLIRLALDGLASFSYLPLQLATLMGFVFATASFAYVVLVSIVLLLGHHPPPGWTSLAFLVVFLGGVQLLCLGTIGEYLGRVYDEVRARPLYIVRSIVTSPGD